MTILYLFCVSALAIGLVAMEKRGEIRLSLAILLGFLGTLALSFLFTLLQYGV